MRIARFALVGALALGAMGCASDDLDPTRANIPPLAFVRYVNAVPDTFNLTVRWVDQLEFSPMTFTNVAYRAMGVGGYQGLEAGSRHFRVFTYDPALGANGAAGATTAQLADTTFDFVAGQYYTILHSGFARTGQVPAQRLYINVDALPAVNTTNVNYRVINAAATVPTAVDVYTTAAPSDAIAGAPAISALGLTSVAPYASRATGAFAAQITEAGTVTRLAGSAAPAGFAATGPDNAVGGATIGGSVLTAIAFGPSVVGSRAAASAAPSVVWFSDRIPPTP